MSNEAMEFLRKYSSEYFASERHFTAMFVLSVTNEICRVMKVKRIRRRELAEKIGLELRELNRFLNADDRLNVKILGKVLKALEVDTQDMFFKIKVKKAEELRQHGAP